MTCHEARERMIESFDAGSSDASELREHVAGCAECQGDWQRNHVAWNMLLPTERIVASHQFLERTMTAIRTEAAKESREVKKKGHAWPRWALVACAAVLLMMLFPLLPFGNSNRAGIALLAQSVHAMSQLRTVHITGQMRTLPRDNFDLIGTEYSFLPVEMWRDYSTPMRWRVEKPGRVVVMDGQQSLMYLPNNNEAVKGTPLTGFVGWLRPLLSPDTVLDFELEAAKAGDTKAELSEAKGEITLTINRKARGNFNNDWVKNKTIDSSDHTRVYTFDAATKLLKKLNVIVHAGGKDVIVLELTSFAYNTPLSDALFTLQLPHGVNWIGDLNAMEAAPTFSGPREAAMFFFDSLSREDWQSVKEVLPVTNVPGSVKTQYGGLTVVSVGVAFRSGMYPGWFVPYEIRLPSGQLKQHKLAIRNDNPQQRWVVDGGW